jgi:hypothetical protein
VAYVALRRPLPVAANYEFDGKLPGAADPKQLKKPKKGCNGN